MANNNKVRLSAAVRQARRRPAVAEAPNRYEAMQVPARTTAAVVVTSSSRSGGIVARVGRIVRRTVYGAVYGVTYTVVFPWALVR